MSLSPEQQQRAIEVMRAYLAAPGPNGRSLVQKEADHDQRRIIVIQHEMKPLLETYLSDRVPLAEFKTRADGINKRNELWGFKGIKGQMFFNMLVNVAADEGECDQELKTALPVPSTEEVASSRIRTFESYIKRIGYEFVESGGSKAGRPKVSSVPYFLTYFWQIQEREVWPIYYTNSVTVMTDLNLWQPIGELAADYISFKHIQEELAEVFSRESAKPFGLYDVEHVFWFKGGNPYIDADLAYDKTSRTPNEAGIVEQPHSIFESPSVLRLPESYVPPIVEILPEMARNDSKLQEAARVSGTSLERAFEKSIDAAFTILGYETKLLGQGKGRVPDGLAQSIDDSYAILWDAKIRGAIYSMGTDDRVIREYIMTQSRDLKKRMRLRNIYYFIISSGFADDFDDAIRSLKMDTDVNEVCLVEVGALVAMVDRKMRFPQDVSLGPDGLQRFFSVSGILTADQVRAALI